MEGGRTVSGKLDSKLRLGQKGISKEDGLVLMVARICGEHGIP